MILSSRMRYFLPILIWSGASKALFTSFLMPYVANSVPISMGKVQQSKYGLLAMVVAAAGAGLGSILCGFVQDSVGTRKTAYFNLASVVIGISTMVWYNMGDIFTF
jgi:hypothetical protein